MKGRANVASCLIDALKRVTLQAFNRGSRRMFEPVDYKKLALLPFGRRAASGSFPPYVGHAATAKYFAADAAHGRKSA